MRYNALVQPNGRHVEAEMQNERTLMNEHRSVACWICEPLNLTDPLVERAKSCWLSEDELRRNDRYRHERDKSLHLTARLMVRAILSRYRPAVSPRDWRFESDIHGKPEIIYNDNPLPPLYFNVTHTDGLVAVAVSESGQIGVDSERVDRPLDHLNLARRFFATVEADALQNSLETLRPELFYRIWTLKEAYVKAIGKGLAHGLDSFWFLPFDLSVNRPRLFQKTDAIADDVAKVSRSWHSWVGRAGDDQAWMLSVVYFRDESDPAEIPVLSFNLADFVGPNEISDDSK